MNNKVLILIFILILGFFTINTVFGDHYTLNSNVNVGYNLYYIKLTVHGHWTHYDLFLNDKATIQSVDVETGVGLALQIYPLSSVYTDNAKIIFSIYDDNGTLVKTVESKFHMMQRDWIHVFILHGFKKGHYKIQLDLYQWLHNGLGPITFWERYIHMDTYTLEVDVG